jgi:enoyl-CoA hydratase/carnithine racemase
MNQDPVIVRQQTDEIAVCCLNRPDKRNALSILLMQQLCGHIERILNDGKTRVLILRGRALFSVPDLILPRL